MRHLLMPRSLLAVPAVLLVAGSLGAKPAAAETTYVETVVHDTTTNVDVRLDADTVLCSSADYGALFLKILIPDLARLTLLDHQNLGAGAPCVAAGMCEPGNMPSDIINPAHPTANVAINVKAVRLDEADSTAQTCNTALVERVQVTIRGVDFFHERYASLGTRPFADCATSSTAPTDPGTGSGSGSGSGSGDTGSGSGDNSADDPYSGGSDEPKTGGCDTSSGGAALSFGLVALGAVLARRRRR